MAFRAKWSKYHTSNFSFLSISDFTIKFIDRDLHIILHFIYCDVKVVLYVQ